MEKEKISNFLSSDLEKNNEIIVKKVRKDSKSKKKYKVKRKDIEKFITSHIVGKIIKEKAFLFKNTIEIPIMREQAMLRPLLIFPFKFNKLTVTDNHLNIKYEITHISLSHLLTIVNKIDDRDTCHRILRRLMIRMYSFDKPFTVYDYNNENVKNLTTEKVLSLCFNNSLRLSVLKIISLDNNKIDENNINYYLTLGYAFIYNLNLSGKRIRLIENYKDYFNIKEFKLRKKKNEIIEQPPRRIYSKNLLDLYFAANWSDNAFTQYVYYYQILEYFFTKIPSDRLIRKVREQLTDPTFIVSKDKDIDNLIQKIKTETNHNEKELFSLKAVLNYFIRDKEFLLNKLDSDNLDYLKRKTPKFLEKVNQSKISIDLTINLEDLITRISKRIYDVRNALVHNKDKVLNNFDPLNDFSDLKKEIPLIKTIAEKIIIDSGKSIDIEDLRDKFENI